MEIEAGLHPTVCLGPRVCPPAGLMGPAGYGVRRAEFADLQLAHVDLDLDVLLVLGKGRRERALPFGTKPVRL
jgi:hypothetical protein